MPRCAIHDDAYDSTFVCETCRADPANVGWREHDAGDVEQSEPDEETNQRRLVALALLRGSSYAGAARAAGCSIDFVRKVVSEILEDS